MPALCRGSVDGTLTVAAPRQPRGRWLTIEQLQRTPCPRCQVRLWEITHDHRGWLASCLGCGFAVEDSPVPPPISDDNRLPTWYGEPL